MAAIPDDLMTFLNEQRDVREYRRGLAVRLALQGYTYDTISTILDVSPGFVSQAKTAYEAQGVAGLLLKYKGSQPYLSDTQRQLVIAWLKDQEEWSVERLRDHIQAAYGVVFQSRQSYYQLLADANMSHKKAQAANPGYNPDLVAAKKKKSANS